MSPISDKSINLTSNDTLTFNEVFNQMYPSLCAFAESFLVPLDEAEDLVQEVFLKLWDRFGKFDSLIGLKSYLYQSTRNRCLNYIRHEKIKRQFENDQHQEIESESYFLKKVMQEETKRLISDAIDNLPPKCKSVIELSLKGMVNNEIAEHLELSVNTVKSQKAKAYDLLRQKLNNTFDLIIHLMII